MVNMILKLATKKDYKTVQISWAAKIYIQSIIIDLNKF